MYEYALMYAHACTRSLHAWHQGACSEECDAFTLTVLLEHAYREVAATMIERTDARRIVDQGSCSDSQIVRSISEGYVLLHPAYVNVVAITHEEAVARAQDLMMLTTTTNDGHMFT